MARLEWGWLGWSGGGWAGGEIMGVELSLMIWVEQVGATAHDLVKILGECEHRRRRLHLH